MDALELTRSIIRSCLQLADDVTLDRDTYLMGNFAEFNSLTITTMIAEIEDQVDTEIDDDEISADIFETVGALADFVEEKMD